MDRQRVQRLEDALESAVLIGGSVAVFGAGGAVGQYRTQVYREAHGSSALAPASYQITTLGMAAGASIIAALVVAGCLEATQRLARRYRKITRESF